MNYVTKRFKSQNTYSKANHREYRRKDKSLMKTEFYLGGPSREALDFSEDEIA